MHKKNLRRWTLLAVGLAVVSSLACNVLDRAASDESDSAAEFKSTEVEELSESIEPSLEEVDQVDVGEVDDDAAGNSLPELIRTNRLDLESVAANGEGIQGQVLLVQLTNPGSEELIVTIPCGYYFSPANEEEQRLMVIQPASVSIPAGGAAAIEPYVICIDSSKAGPEASSTYRLGDVATGDLLELAQCLCQEELASPDDPAADMDVIGVQFAVWAVSDGILGEDMGAEMLEAQGAMQEMLGGELGGEFGEEFAEMIQQMMDLYGGGAQFWLERCGIELDTQAP